MGGRSFPTSTPTSSRARVPTRCLPCEIPNSPQLDPFTFLTSHHITSTSSFARHQMNMIMSMHTQTPHACTCLRTHAYSLAVHTNEYAYQTILGSLSRLPPAPCDGSCYSDVVLYLLLSTHPSMMHTFKALAILTLPVPAGSPCTVLKKLRSQHILFHQGIARNFSTLSRPRGWEKGKDRVPVPGQ
jgi:hypothetical protein